ncbi:recombinase family protein [Candidatus Dojkabacteria bacterium]|uniref:Recombinase family protein n=1 Tax=Candidatus Dojkabacteria bacterium TaxID=2099670 RepID=A0A955L0D9_9BACT|nr:recombinase family protein [Candidatus Dojkabacteria bacterium]
MENILASFAQFDNEVRTERIVNGLRSRVEQGFWIWDPPLGYIRDYTSSSNPKPIIKDKSKEVFIQQAWDMFLTGHYQMAEIVRFLNSNNVRTKNNKPIDRRLISKILRNPFYAGIVYSDKFGIKVPGKHKGYVTELEFNKIQKIIENNINKAKTVYKNDEYSLNRTIKCINCGNLLSGAKSKGKKKYYYYYQCGNSNCPFRQAVNKDVAEEKFIELLESIQMPQDDLELFKEIIIDVYECEYDISIQQQDEAYNNIKKVESKLKKIQQLLEDGVYSSEEYINRKNELDAELITLKITSSELGINKDELETCINYICKFIKHLPIFWKGLSNNEKRKLNSLLFPDGLEFEKNAYRTPKIHEALVIFNTVNTINKEGTFEVIETSLGDPGETRTRNQ